MNCANHFCPATPPEHPATCPHGLAFCDDCTWEHSCDDCSRTAWLDALNTVRATAGRSTLDAFGGPTYDPAVADWESIAEDRCIRRGFDTSDRAADRAAEREHVRRWGA